MVLVTNNRNHSIQSPAWIYDLGLRVSSGSPGPSIGRVTGRESEGTILEMKGAMKTTEQLEYPPLTWVQSINASVVMGIWGKMEVIRGVYPPQAPYAQASLYPSAALKAGDLGWSFISGPQASVLTLTAV